MANKSERVKIGQETLDIIKVGVYKVGNTSVHISDQVEASISKAQVFTEKDLSNLNHCNKLQKNPQILEVTHEHAISACRRIRGEDPDGKIGCLNFASAKNVCGGMLKGSLAQEESLGYCTTLYPTLERFQSEYYDENRKDPKRGLYNDTLIVSPDVLVIRDDVSYELIEDPFPVTFISSPAVNKGHALTFKEVSETLVQTTMERRIFNVLKVALQYNIEYLVLGAWGCGVFKNEPKEIANMFRKCISKKDTPFCNQFTKLVFAIGSDKVKYEVFQEALAV